MIPLKDYTPTRSYPWVTKMIVIVNVGVFIYQLFIGPLDFESYIRLYGLTPARVTHSYFAFPTFISAMFMHGGFGHIIGNMWFLWIFGDNVEDSLGKGRFLFFYLLTGILAFLAHVAFDPGSKIPLVGASGAIAGVLGGYIVLFPRARILTLIPIIFFITTAQVPAAFFLGIWFLMQLLYSMAGVGGPVAFLAHVGGFVSGMVLVRAFLPPRNYSRTS